MVNANALNASFVQSVEELAANVKPIELSENSVNDTARSFFITETDQSQIQQTINQLNNSKAKYIFGLNTDFIKSMLIL